MKVAVPLLLALATPALAGVFSPNEPCPFEVAGGVAKPLPHAKFKSLRNDRLAELNPALPEFEEVDTATGKQLVPTARGKAVARVRDLAAKVERLSPAERLGLSADLVRTGTLGKELAALKRVTGERPRDYRLAANFAHAETLGGNWSVAARGFEDHVLELDPPAELPGTSAEQLKWMLTVDGKAYRDWLRARAAEQRRAEQGRKVSAEDAAVYPLFPAVTFVGTELAAEGKAKLPADAVAVVQQLALWSPTDTGLLWLLAEVYAATGRLREANDAFDMCTWGAGMTGPKRLRDHRRLILAAVEKLPPVADDIVPTDTAFPADTPGPPPPEDGIFAVVPRAKLLLFGFFFLAFAVPLLALQVRAWRRSRGRSLG